ncbi:MAG: 23S rRNA (pseudouridine(1915)-N(3))-methyltransferase RlmH [Gemmatimonadota bacterium]
MKLELVAVGRPDARLAEAIREYEARASRYWPFESVEVKAERAGRGVGPAEVRRAESARLRDRVGPGLDVVALTRMGRGLTSMNLAAYIQELALRSLPGAAFVIGGAYGLSEELIRSADRRLSLSTLTLPHDLARLVLVEQLYRAGTIARGEPYHKGGS